LKRVCFVVPPRNDSFLAPQGGALLLVQSSSIEPALGKLETRFRTFEFVILKLSRVSDFVLRI